MGNEVEYPYVLVKPGVPDFIAQGNGYRHQSDVDPYAACDEIPKDIQEHVGSLAVRFVAAEKKKARPRPWGQRPPLHQGVRHEIIQDYGGTGAPEARHIVLPILRLHY